MGIYWRSKHYIDKCLPFGLRSAPYLFNMVADALEWTLRRHFYINHLFHYLDDFFLVARASSSDCLNGLLDTLFLCRTVGAPVKPEKVLGPSTTLTVLGIELDTNLMQARLPQDKLAALLEELSHFKLLHASCLRCTKRQLLSLIGKLAFTCKVIPAGRIFLRRLLDTAHSVEGLEKQVPITLHTSKDVEWWLTFWNPTGHQHTSSSYLQMPLDILAMGHFGMVIGLVCHGLQTSSTNPLNGRNCMLSLLLVEPGASTGRGNGCSSTVITRQWLRSGNLVAHAVQTLWTWCGPCFLWQQITISMF